MTKKTKVTVLLTTYNRADFLKLAIKSVLVQDFQDFELIVADDASPDQTKSVVASFKDKRIVYIKNKKNLGFPGNFRNAVERSKGKYIFLLSDDDFILRSDTLSIIYKEMEAKRAAFGRISLIFYEDDLTNPVFVATPPINREICQPASSDILVKTANWHFGFASGNIYRKDFIKKEDIIEDVWFSHVKPIYRIIRQEGAIYFGNHFIVSKISMGINASYLNIDVNKGFHMAKLFKLFKEFDNSSENYKIFKKKHFDGVVKTFPGIKFYTSNENIIEMARQVVKIDNTYQRNPIFWINLIIAIITPKFILGLIRSFRLYLKSFSLKKYLTQINYDKYAKVFITG